MVPASVVVSAAVGPGCETPGHGLLAEPVSAVSSLAFVAAGLAVVALGRRPAGRPRGGGSAADGSPGPGGSLGRGSDDSDVGEPRRLAGYARLVAAIGVGSVIQHGPDPAWSDVAHDAPLLATLLLVAADDVAVLTGRRRAWWWWAAPTVALLPVVVAAPRAGDLAQAGIAAVAVALTLARARAVPAQRRAVGWSVGLLAVGAVVGSLSRAGGPLCVSDSPWQGHAVWHVLAAAGLVVLGQVVGEPTSDPCRRAPTSVPPGTMTP